jgi:hypothetical protein
MERGFVISGPEDRWRWAARAECRSRITRLLIDVNATD